MGQSKPIENCTTLSESIHNPTVHADGLEAFHIGTHVHILYWADVPTCAGGRVQTERQVVARIALPEEVYSAVCARLRRGENIIQSSMDSLMHYATRS